MTNNEIKQRDKKYVCNSYNRFNVALKQGKGAKCVDYDGKEYIDFTSGIGVNSIGYCNEKWAKAVYEGLTTLSHTSNIYYTSPCGEVAEQLCNRTHFKKVFFANSGAEANEGAIKCARKYSQEKYGKHKYEIVSLVNSFHGRTISTLAMTGQDVFHKNFQPLTEGFVYAEANNYNDVIAKITNNTAAVIMELVQGEGGVIKLNSDFVKSVYDYCKENDIIFIVDEVQTGIGRTGTLFAFEQFGIEPDIVTCAKGIGGGLPLGAVLFNDKTEKVFGFGDHATTFGGNPAICRGSLVVLETLNDEFLKEVTKKGNYIRDMVTKIPHVKSTSGLGLMIGVELADYINARTIVDSCIENGLLLLLAKTKLRFLPPLNITYEEIDAGLKILNKVLNNFKK